jgi:organic radical activating enzyme
MGVKLCSYILEFIINDHCNLQCQYCSHGSPNIKNKITMSFARIKEMSAFFSGYVFDGLKISGGEPTLHPEFAEISRNMRDIFCANFYMFSTNGAMLQKYLEVIQNYNSVDFSLYRGYNDNIFYEIKKLAIPNIVHIERFEEEAIFDPTDVNHHETFNKVYYCQYAHTLKICHERIAPCALAFANCVRNPELNYNNVSVPVDEHWAKNIEPLKAAMKDFCDRCHVNVFPEGDPLSMPVPRKFKYTLLDDQDVYAAVMNPRIIGKNRFYTPSRKITAAVVKQLSGKISPFEIENIRTESTHSFWEYTLFRKSVSEEGDIDQHITHTSAAFEDMENLMNNPEMINTHTSHIHSKFFDIPFFEKQVINVVFSFEHEDSKPFFCQIQDENFAVLAQSHCRPVNGIWEWSFPLGHFCDRIRFLITSSEIYAVKPPQGVKVSSGAQSIDFVKYRLTLNTLNKKTREYEKLQAELFDSRDALLNSRWRKLGIKLGIVKKIPGLEE